MYRICSVRKNVLKIWKCHVRSSYKTYLTHFNEERKRKRPSAGSFGIKFSDVSRFANVMDGASSTRDFVPRERELFDSYRFSDISVSEAIDPTTNRVPTRTHARKCPSMYVREYIQIRQIRQDGRALFVGVPTKILAETQGTCPVLNERFSGEEQHVARQRNNCHLR